MKALSLFSFFEWSKVNSVLLLSYSSVEIVPRDESLFSEINKYILFWPVPVSMYTKPYFKTWPGTWNFSFFIDFKIFTIILFLLHFDHLFFITITVFTNILFTVCRWSTFEKCLINPACSNGSLKYMSPYSPWSPAFLWKSYVTLRRLEKNNLPFSSTSAKDI